VAEEERTMMVPGAYFRDETIWRGRMIEFACDLKATLYELGLVSCTSRLSCNWKGYQWPWAWAYLQEMRGGKRAEREIGRYVNEAYRS